MTHVQRLWTAKEAYEKHHDIRPEDVQALGEWSKTQSDKMPQQITEEQLILFLHSCYNNLDNAKKCMTAYYSIRRKARNMLQDRSIALPEVQRALDVLNFGIINRETPEGYTIFFHSLRITDPSQYSFNVGVKLLSMALDSVYAKKGPSAGCTFLFDLAGVKFGHVIRLPMASIKRGMAYIQEGNPVRLKSIHVLNCNSIVDKIMMLVKPFLKAHLLEILHFHKENDETVLEYIPKECMPSNFFGGSATSVEDMRDEFIADMKNFQTLFEAEDDFLAPTFTKKADAKAEQEPPSVSRLEID